MLERIEAKNLRQYDDEQLNSALKEMKTFKGQLLQHKSSHTIKSQEISTARKNIARGMTIMQDRKIERMVEKHKNDKHLPKDMRMRKTKKERLALTRNQLKMKTRRQNAREAKYKPVYFAYVGEDN